MIEKKEAALKLAERGLRVFPLHSVAGGECTCRKSDCGSPGKHPATSNGFKDATCDPVQVAEWWGANPDKNVGVATGGESRLLVIDIDDDAAMTEFRRLEEQHGRIPRTVTVKTSRGLISGCAVRTASRSGTGPAWAGSRSTCGGRWLCRRSAQRAQVRSPVRVDRGAGRVRHRRRPPVAR